MAAVTTLREAFLDEIRDIYHAEKQLVKALPKLARAATHPHQ
jgi:ferritin-like metal-binding protein YciE